MDSRAWDERYAASEQVWSLGPNQFVERECAALPPGTAVDLAAGEGRNALWLASLGWHVHAVDFSRVALERGASRAAGLELTGSVSWVEADATSWTPPEPVDLVVVAYLQLPADERRAAVQGAARMLAPGGTMVLVAHDSTNLAEGTGGPQDPAVLMTAQDVLADLEALEESAFTESFEVQHADRVAREVTAPDGHGGEVRRTAWDCLVRVRRR